jgi:hypothetical protein
MSFFMSAFQLLMSEFSPACKPADRMSHAFHRLVDETHHSLQQAAGAGLSWAAEGAGKEWNRSHDFPPD